MVYIGISVSGACEGTSLRLLEQLHSWSCINVGLRNPSQVIICAVNLFNISNCYTFFLEKLQDPIAMSSIIPNIRIPNYC